jgi:hypothetical protein
MEKLEKLMQNEFGSFFRADEEKAVEYVYPAGKIKSITIQNPTDISSVIDEMAERNSAFIPKCANAYVASEFNADTQHLGKTGDGEGFFSVYAVQFYSIIR